MLTHILSEADTPVYRSWEQAGRLVHSCRYTPTPRTSAGQDRQWSSADSEKPNTHTETKHLNHRNYHINCNFSCKSLVSQQSHGWADNRIYTTGTEQTTAHLSKPAGNEKTLSHLQTYACGIIKCRKELCPYSKLPQAPQNTVPASS